MKVPDPELTAQLHGSPASVRLSTMAAMDGDRVHSFYIVMSDQDGKILASHPINSFEEVAAIGERLVADAAIVWRRS